MTLIDNPCRTEIIRVLSIERVGFRVLVRVCEILKMSSVQESVLQTTYSTRYYVTESYSVYSVRKIKYQEKKKPKEEQGNSIFGTVRKG